MFASVSVCQCQCQCQCRRVSVGANVNTSVCQCHPTLAVTSGECGVTRSEECSDEEERGLPVPIWSGVDRPRRTPFCQNRGQRSDTGHRVEVTGSGGHRSGTGHRLEVTGSGLRCSQSMGQGSLIRPQERDPRSQVRGRGHGSQSSSRGRIFHGQPSQGLTQLHGLKLQAKKSRVFDSDVTGTSV